MAVGDNISKRRGKLGMTQQDLADAIGVSYPRISELEKGKSNPRLTTLEKVAIALKTTVSKLVRETAVN